MVDDMNGMMNRIAETSTELAPVADELSDLTRQIAGNDGQVLAVPQSGATALEREDAKVQEVSRDAGAVNERTEEAGTVANEGFGVDSETVASSSETPTVPDPSLDPVKALSAEAEKINVVVDLVEDIGDQANLLALNSAVEVARVGEEGESFADVAEDVWDLVEKTAEASSEITRAVASIQKGIQQAVAALGDGTAKGPSGSGSGERSSFTGGGFEVDSSRSTDRTVQIASATERLARTIREIAGSVEQAALDACQRSAGALQIGQIAGAVPSRGGEYEEFGDRAQV
jgi:methyl-accepting chemotaxis protein